LGVNSLIGKTEVNINSPSNGISIYRGNSTTPSVSLTKKAVERILNK